MNPLDFVKIQNVFRDILFLMFGLIFLIFLNYFIKPDINNIPNISYVGNFEKIFILVSFSYIAGRLLMLISEIWMKFVDAIFFKKNLFRIIGNRYKEYLSIVNRETIQIKGIGDIDHEVDCFIEKNNNFKNEFERYRYSGINNRLLLGFFIASLFVKTSVIFFILSIFVILLLSLFCIESSIEISRFWRRMGKAALKEKITKH